ncbi:hypothetical protein BU24DRAFT_463218 [Aaosphaeria arxii CBS 175.79]|uniref:Uncharacterized protein n=1 Tax=Aaosphaeria arxii CBS 175.79 TaxID=1450172 RepID=A0A6A5XNE6_9PLEO|nr:uncharacterized protein BU24DRAFT_463218 [Aaosphaeria arxii CBS 175.79]KAF2014426.1 hypothetical protein BU24DRAFT_463218 [Aaosphaeria arxii CBS 175.79]
MDIRDPQANVTSQRTPLALVAPLLEDNGWSMIELGLTVNRGGLACRVATCRRLNITAITIYVEESNHTDCFTDTGGSNSPRLRLSQRSQRLPLAVCEHGLIFVGPSSEAMPTFGDKRASKPYLREHLPDLPLIPGFYGSCQQRSLFMLKTSSDKNGTGIRIVREESQLQAELD